MIYDRRDMQLAMGWIIMIDLFETEWVKWMDLMRDFYGWDLFMFSGGSLDPVGRG